MFVCVADASAENLKTPKKKKKGKEDDQSTHDDNFDLRSV